MRTEISCGPKGKKLAWYWFSVRIQTVKTWPFSILYVWENIQLEVSEKVTAGITGLWQPSVHCDVAFRSFDVGPSYHWDAEVPKCRIVRPPKGNVSWVSTVVRQVSFTLIKRCCDSNRSQYGRSTSFRYVVNVAHRKANTTKLTSVRLLCSTE